MAGKRPTPKQMKKRNKEITGFCLIVLAILMWIAVFSVAGAPVLSGIRVAMLGIFGASAYIVPAVIIAIGAMVIISVEKKVHLGKNMLIGGMALCLLALFQLFFLRQVLWAQDLSFWSYIKNSFELGTVQLAGAGALGAILTYLPLAGIGITATFLVIIAVLIILAVILFNLSLSKISMEVTDKVRTTIDDYKEVRRQKKQDLYTEDLREQEEEDHLPRLSGELQFNTPLAEGGGGCVAFEDSMGNYRPDLFKTKTELGGRGDDYILPDEPIQFTSDTPIAPITPIKKAVPLRMQPKPVNRPVNAVPPIVQQPEEEPEDQYDQDPDDINLHGLPQDEEEIIPHAPAEEYVIPPVTLLRQPEPPKRGGNAREEAIEKARRLEETLQNFDIDAKVAQVTRGPAITRFELTLAPGIKVRRVVGLADDIALSLAAMGVRIEAPIPGKAAIGIEIPNESTSFVTLREMLESETFSAHPSSVAAALGKDLTGKPVLVDLSRMPHLLIAGATGSGKSACINSLITSILYKASPQDVRMIMVDPKVVELSVYNGIPHLISPVVTEAKKAAGALEGAVREMERRYRLLSHKGVRDLKGYNASITPEDIEKGEDKLPIILVIIDELADLMMVAGKQVEASICRLAQMARAVGIHLVIATQRPSVDVITGLIKANIPSRIAFAVSSQIDSRTILDMAGAEKLLGMGDMLFYPTGASKPARIQGSFISDGEVQAVVDFVRQSGDEPQYDPALMEAMEKFASGGSGGGSSDDSDGDMDELMMDAVELALENGKVSTSMLQRRFRVGYARAGRLMDEMELRGIISAPDGSRPRSVLISQSDFARMFGGVEEEI